MDLLRTPDARFESLPEFPWAPRYVEVGNPHERLRVHYIDEGPRDAPVVLMMHGEPSWSFLYRKIIAAVLKAGLRAVAPDLVGFGRSDKPTRADDYTYLRHVDWMAGFLRAVDLRGVTLLCQDWGGLIGLRLVAEHEARFDRVIAANTFLPTGDQKFPDAFFQWQQFSQTVPELPIGGIVRMGCATAPSKEILAAYEAPFPDESFKAGARKFPLLVPTSPDDPEAEPNRRAWKTLEQFRKPFLTAFGDSDPITAGADRVLQERIPGCAGQPHTTIAKAGHFLQEDQGEALANVVIDFMR